jgi:hypothetical protein
MHAATTTGARGTERLVIKGVPMAVDMRTTTIKGARGTAWTTVEGECMTIDMCAATIKGARGAARTTNGEPMARSVRTATTKGGSAARLGGANVGATSVAA